MIARFKRDVKNFLTLPEMGSQLDRKPAVILIVGVNGSGKTTTIGKLATAMKRNRRKVLLVAADTFRAAAAEQLTIWAERAGVDIVRGNEGADPSSVVFDGMVAAKSRGVDVVLVDTAGRLQTKTNLMEELKKMRRVIERETGAPPAETLLVLDGTTGQNALSQAKLFNEATQLTGVIVTKLDSTSKGGVLVGIVDQLTVPIKYIGLGETADALQPFDPDAVHQSAVRTGRITSASASRVGCLCLKERCPPVFKSAARPVSPRACRGAAAIMTSEAGPSTSLGMIRCGALRIPEVAVAGEPCVEAGESARF